MVTGLATIGLDTAIQASTPLQLFTGEFIQYAIIFFVLAILAAIVGARGVAGVSLAVAKWFVVVFVILAILSLVL